MNHGHHGDHNPNDPPASLKIPKEPPVVDHKPFSPSSNSTATAAANNHPPRRRPPIIIYTHPPKVYHTTPSGFKELVQRLTGKPKPSVNAVNGATNSTPAPPPAKKPELPAAAPNGSSSMSAEDCRLVGGENSACSTSSSQPSSSNSILAEASPTFVDDANLYSPPLKKVKLDKDTLNASLQSPSENSELAYYEDFAFSSLLPSTASPVYRDLPQSTCSLLEEIPPSMLADIDLDSPPSAKKLTSVSSGFLGNENFNSTSLMAPMDEPPPSPSSLIENPFAVSLLEDFSNFSVFSLPNSEGSEDGARQLMVKRKQH